MSEWIVADGHVHLYGCADPERFLEAAWGNLSAAARGFGAARWKACLFFTETARDNAFDTLCRAGVALSAGWVLRRLPEDPAAAVLQRDRDGATLTVIAGRQVVSAERIEVLALATKQRFRDGQPAADLLAELQAAGIPAVLPWGVGKWLGRRGRLVAELVQAQAGPGLFLGDNAGRPLGWPEPPLFRRWPMVLPGSDPLPVPGAEAGVGRYGFALEGTLSPDRPAAELASRLMTLRGQPLAVGGRRGLATVLAEQFALRRSKRHRRLGGTAA